ncbi:NADPH oxidase 5 [Hypsibius exemplaris]|uniref:NADPH oxidase 5 n=1 Tax=Hypsibius exemplaris TaxID=2072580 RepID=A0A9X6NIK2_HYPEX|nr:NADPH oxidase 5 [Hypsibius exemplaris]
MAESEKTAFKGNPENMSEIFQTLDLNGDGLISREKLTTSLEAMISDHKLHLSKDQVHAMTEAIFQSVVIDVAAERRKSILTAAEFSQVSREALERRMSFAVLQLEETDSSCLSRIHQFLKVYRLQTIWVALFYALQVMLFFVRMKKYHVDLPTSCCAYSDLGMVSVCFGMCVQVNVAILLMFPALRWTAGYLRRTPLANIIPFDSSISFHIIVGSTTMLLAILHSGLYILNMYFNSLKPLYQGLNFTFVRMLTESGIIGDDYLGYTSVSGLILLSCMAIIGVFSLPPIRNSILYDVFYWTHKLHYVVWAAIIVHAPTFWQYLVFPLTLLFLEKIHKYYNVLRWSGTTRITEVNLLPHNVTQLVVTRPRSFTFNPGDYVYIKVPCLGVLSWHPFTLSSAPEQKDVLWLHIKASGNWTKQLRQHFSRHVVLNLDKVHAQTQTISSDRPAKDDLHMQPIVPTIRHVPNLNVRILLDGPYGASTTALFDTEHAVLIGAGIGVTPFASVLGSVLAQYRQMTNAGKTATNKDGTTSMAINERKLKLKKLDFIWVSREQENIQWFIDLLQGWEQQQQGLSVKDLFMDCQFYVTSIPDSFRHWSFGGTEPRHFPTEANGVTPMPAPIRTACLSMKRAWSRRITVRQEGSGR